MTRVLVLTVIVLMLAGCGGGMKNLWVKSGATEQEFQRDSYECASTSTYTSRKAGLGGGAGFYREKTDVNEDLYRACLRARGYSRIKTDRGWKGLD